MNAGAYIEGVGAVGGRGGSAGRSVMRRRKSSRESMRRVRELKKKDHHEIA